jgi:hypothetical protein
MMKAADDRIPLRFGPAASVRPGEAVLIAGTQVPRHVAGCACCAGRGAVASALGALFQDRAIGRVAWFDAVLAEVADPVSAAAEVRGDRLAAARFRLVE